MGVIVSITYLPASVDDIRPAGHYARVPIDATELVNLRLRPADNHGVCLIPVLVS